MPRFQPGTFVYVVQGRTITRGSIRSVTLRGHDNRWMYAFESYGDSTHSMAEEDDVFDEFSGAFERLKESLPAENGGGE